MPFLKMPTTKLPTPMVIPEEPNQLERELSTTILMLKQLAKDICTNLSTPENPKTLINTMRELPLKVEPSEKLSKML